MDDLEKAILISFDESGSVDSMLKSQAIAFCGQIKESPSICSICIDRLRFSKLVQVQFWCLQCLHDALRVRYSSMSSEEKLLIRKSVFSMACYETSDDMNLVKVLDGPAFIKNKLAQVFVTLIYFEYPLTWPSVFVDFLPNLSKGAVVIDMFCRVLNAMDDELISLDYPRSQEEAAVAGRVKDAMRQQCIGQIVRAWYDVLLMYRNSDPDLCTSVLDSMMRYVSWIDIGLIVNDAFVALLFESMLVDGLPDQLRAAAAGCVQAVVSKRMDPKAKITLLQNLQIRRVFGLVVGDRDSEFVSSIASLLTAYATEILEGFKRIDSEDGRAVSMELLNEVLPSVFYAMQHCEIDETFSIVQFLSGYVGMMKSLSPLSETQLHHLGQILEVIRSQIRYDSSYRNNLDLCDKIGKEEEDRMVEFRKDLLVLLRSVGRVAPDVTQIFIRNSLASAVASSEDKNIEEIEAALSLFYSFGESVTDEIMRTGGGLLGDLVPMLLSTKFRCHSNRLVALVYLETITRYVKFVQESTQYIPMVLGAFLDERGIHHPNIKVSRRASYLFMRVVKLLKAKLVPYIETILQSLQDTVSQFTTMSYSSKEFLGSEDGSHIFEAIGLLIGMEDVPLEKQSEYLSALLTPLCRQVEALLLNAKLVNPEESPGKIVNLQQIIMAINALSKGFSERLVTASRPAIGLMFKQTLDVMLQILDVFPKVESLRCKVTSFVHRMVETLGASVFPYLPKALELLLVESEPKEVVGFLVLLNQLICKFNTAVGDILEEVYPAIAGRVFSILPRDDIPSGPGGNTEEIRELRELQRMFYTFLHVIATHDLSSVFLSAKTRVYLDTMMQMLLYSCCTHKDITIRKACVQIFIRLIKDWCTRPYGEEKVPGFQSFIIEVFATNCCLYSVLDKSFEFRDANTLVLFGEIVLAQKVMYEKFGNDFLVHFVSKSFPSAHCPQDLTEQYCQKLQGNDMKALKSCYQSIIENLRRQQNGGALFR
ncbi:PREDICTED: exportin-T-like [Ipomoea nil]|uniref:exportin-T-like n=1 Tax=Ipomoea nil TaxID=35883 RepID=UPI000900F798|nr:PREDICTED: exportin-T-like [Ipomoea nil]XP_019198753.1 PREDICTED: exportin-T-like [Ipomoea nil]XP_019198754.1 PREDICTED: exportin-T-like [Ipomoea nil]